MLKVDKATVAYGRITAVREVSLTVNDGEIITIIGSNGAGKTSLLNAITGVVPLKSGEIHLNELHITGSPPHRTVKLGMAYVPEGRQLFGAMSVKDNLTMGAYHQCQQKKLGSLGYAGAFLKRTDIKTNLESVYKMFPVLKERLKQKAGNLSGGEQQMLAIGRALMSSPRMIILDEPSLGLAPNLVREILKLIVRLRDEGITILLVEQDANAALKIADRGYVMERGQITIEGTAQDLLGNDRVRQAYLGKSVA